MSPVIQAIADSVVKKPHLFKQNINVLAWNFARVIGLPSLCPRCHLRGYAVRWFPVREGEYQRYDCENCGYGVKDR